ncbi:unnamed protein product [Lota lota]
MDTHVKAGQVYLQPRKIGKKWTQVWLALYPASLCSIGRLEIRAGVGGERPSAVLGCDTKRQGHKERKSKVVRLSDIISVRKLPPHAEALPKDNMAAFCVKTEERNLVFSAMKDESTEWVEKMCEMAFQNPSVSGTSSKPHMEENVIYASTEEAGVFSVVVQQTDAAARCGLQGAYRLHVGQDDLTLRESENPRTIWSWPYRLLRRYGKDNLALTIEAGRRCDSGPGTFTFETGQASVLFGLIENAIKHQTYSTAVTNSPVIHIPQNPDGVATLPCRRPRSPLPKIPDMSSIPAILQIKSNTLVDSEESLYAQPADWIRAPECANAQPLDKIASTKASAPVSCMMVSEHPSIDGMERSGSNPHLGVTSVYVDPASFLSLKPPTTSSTMEAPGPSLHPSLAPSTHHANSPEPIYSEVYGKLSPGQRRAHPTQSQKGEMDKEPIYDEPVRKAEGVAKKNDKQDPFAHLYAQVRRFTPSPEKTIPFSSSGSAGTSAINSSDEALSDVIYETLGII